MSVETSPDAGGATRVPHGARRTSVGAVALYAAMLAVTFGLARLFPPSGDDWSRIAFGPRTIGALVHKAEQTYTSHNGRLLGNALSFALIEPTWLRAAAKAAAIVGLVALTSWVAGGRSAATTLLAFTGLLALPPHLFRESYGWSAGFFNYVPPMLAVLFLAGLVGRSDAGRQDSGWRRALIVVLAFLSTAAGCLFVEHVTAALLVLAVGALVLLAVRRRFDAAILAAALGAILGTVVMLSSPGLRAVRSHQDDYFSYAASPADLLRTAVPNYATITESFVLSNPFLLALVTVVCLGLVARPTGRRRGWPDLVVAVGVVLAGVWAGSSRLWAVHRLICASDELANCDPVALGVDLIALLLLLVVIVIAAARRLAPGLERRTAAALLVATLAMLGPLLVVAPIGPRNLYGPTVTVLALVALLARPLLAAPTCRTRRAVNGLLGALAVACAAALFVIQRANAEVAAERIAVMEAAIRADAPRAALPPFPYPDWVHQPNDKKIGLRYYRQRPRDIAVTGR